MSGRPSSPVGRVSAWAAIAALGAGRVSAQTLGAAAETGPPWWRVLGALVLCLCLATGAAYALRTRLGARAGSGVGRLPPLAGLVARLGLAPVPARRLKLIETLKVSPHLEVCLLAWDDQELAVGATPQGGFLIASRPRAPDEETAQ